MKKSRTEEYLFYRGDKFLKQKAKLMLESSIVREIGENKDRLRFIKKFKDSEWSSAYSYEYRFYLNKRNIFGFRKYLTIILDEYSYITIRIPAFITDIGLDEEVEISDYDNIHILKKILEDCYEDKSRYIILKNLYEIIKNNLKKGKEKENE